MTSKNCIIIHGCPSNSSDDSFNKHWIPWTKEQLELNGFSVFTPIMPTPWKPDYDLYKLVMDSLEVNEQSVLIGHSCGCAFLVRWLGETKKKIASLILVAPWKIPDTGDLARENFYVYDIDSSIKERVNKIVLFTSDNEELDGKESVNMFHSVLGGEVIELMGRGHYTERHMGTNEFPELLNELLL